ncbi:MAG TPA: tyrosine-type recombinase/integrase [Aggregatilinea sp.]|uniref:tyrosine-type recombinase/integrase n=1 Tax=Aggregatilinea sp. TaxID=2806333 RepID=UPI002BF236ED|nr:tyrosine-type recombinase/integrase [Aggregatilinea sp.]HML23134.1 tyrosine-type recombinase/integrase [Aggregatilinea sp.]
MSAPGLDATIRRYLQHYSNDKTREHASYALRALPAVLGEATPLDAITPDDLDDWNDRLSDQGYAPSTLATRRRHVKAFFNWCVKRELLDRSPARFLDVREPRRSLVNKAMPEAVLRDVLQLARRHPYRMLAVRNTAILVLMATYGARVGDVARLVTGGVLFDRELLVLKVKGSKEVELPLMAEVEQVLQLWWAMRAGLHPAPGHDTLFVSTQGRGGERWPPLSTAAIRALVERLSQEVCGTAYGPHSIRHWRGQSLADSGTAPTVVQHVLGHGDVQTTLRFYYNQDMERVAQALEAHQPPAPEEEPPKPKIIPFRRIV